MVSSLRIDMVPFLASSKMWVFAYWPNANELSHVKEKKSRFIKQTWISAPMGIYAVGRIKCSPAENIKINICNITIVSYSTVPHNMTYHGKSNTP